MGAAVAPFNAAALHISNFCFHARVPAAHVYIPRSWRCIVLHFYSRDVSLYYSFEFFELFPNKGGEFILNIPQFFSSVFYQQQNFYIY